MTDPVRSRQSDRVLTDEEKNSLEDIRGLGDLFLGVCDAHGSSRELSIAKTKIEEAVMWAVKHVTK